MPQSGTNKAVGDDMRRGFELFLDLNRRRLGGYDVQLVAADEGDTKETAKAGMEKLKSENVLAVSGVASAVTMTEVREIVEEAHIPLIGSNASPPQLNTLYIWRTSYIDTELGDSLGEYVASQIGTGTAYMIAAEQIGSDAVQGFQQSLLAASGSIEGAAVYVPAGVTNFSQWLNPLKSNNSVKAVFAFFTGATAEAFVRSTARRSSPRSRCTGPATSPRVHC